MNIPDFIKESVYLPYFRRHGSKVRSQQILLGLGIGLLVMAGAVAWWLWSRRCRGTTCAVTPSDD